MYAAGRKERSCKTHCFILLVMVFRFSSENASSPDIYMGKDKLENEKLIAEAFDSDVWFHVSNLSSAHVYLRLGPGQDWEKIDSELLAQVGQLTKANSIQGNKNSNVTVIYTPRSNLLKTAGMEAGAVSFHDGQKLKKIFVGEKDRPMVNRLNKTKKEESIEEFVDAKWAIIKAENRKKAQEKRAKDREADVAKREAKVLKNQKDSYYNDYMSQSAPSAKFDEDDFW